MELIVFDLDGTLLDASGSMSHLTRQTLAGLSRQGVAYTVATGRTLHASQDLLEGHGFHLPQVFKNGVMIWNPANDELQHQNALSLDEVAFLLGYSSQGTFSRAFKGWTGKSPTELLSGAN